MREIPRRNGTYHADGFPHDGAAGGDAHRRRDAEIGLPLVGLRGVGGEPEIVDRALQLRGGGQHPRRTHLRDGDLAQFLDVFAQCVLQLTQAAHPQPGVGRPVGLVEGTAGRLDGTAHVLGVGIGGDAQHLLAGRVDRREGARTAGHQLAVDE